MATGHLVTNLKLALDGDVDLDHLDDARGQLVALLEALDLLLKVLLESLNLLTEVYQSFAMRSTAVGNLI